MTEESLPAYFQIDGAPGLRMFRCARLRATISDRACGTNFLRSQKLRPDQITSTHLCRECPIGAHTAGVPLVRRSGLHGVDLCPRCRRHSERIINGTRCVSCANREYEWVRGYGGKHTPVRMAPLLPRRVRIVINGVATELRAERTRDASEMVLAVLRVAEGRAMFCRPRRGAALALVDWIAERRQLTGMNAERRPASASTRAATEARRAEIAAAMSPLAVAAGIERRAAGIARSRQRMAREARQ
jgi:hypothetical protein